jgi:NDP-sugar pyrophosphorylase family protein
MDGCRVAADARISGSILGRDVNILAGAVLTDCVIGDHQVIESGSVLESELIPRPE